MCTRRKTHTDTGLKEKNISVVSIIQPQVDVLEKNWNQRRNFPDRVYVSVILHEPQS